MKNILIISGVIIVLGLFAVGLRSGSDETPMSTGDTDQTNSGVAGGVIVTPISHATAVLTIGDVVVYTDPLGGAVAFVGQEAPDIILVTDTHGDHLNVSTLESVSTEGTVLIAPQNVADELPAKLLEKTVVLTNGENTEQKGVVIQAIPMYNLPESDDAAHTKGRGNGYVLAADDTRVYVAGDTGGTPEMRALTDIDVALVPMNMPFTMTIQEAAEAVLAFAPKQVYPYHYRGRDGLSDVDLFKQLVESQNSDIEVVLLDWYPVEEEATPEKTVMEEVQTPAVKSFNVGGVDFAFDVEEIRVQQGDTVTIVFTSNDGFHDWVVDEFEARTEKVRTGATSSVTFVADTAGEYEYYCSVGNHRQQGMVGTLIVE